MATRTITVGTAGVPLDREVGGKGDEIGTVKG